MRDGIRAFTLATGALALAMLALTGTSKAIPGPALDGLGSARPAVNIEKTIGGATTGELTPEKITYRSRYYYRGNPFWYYRSYRSPRNRYYGRGRT